MDCKSILKHYAYQNIPLWYDQAYELGATAVAACAENADPQLRTQTIAVLSALHNQATYAHRGDGKTTPCSAAEQIAGICAAVFCEDIARSAYGFAQPVVPFVMDNCGMGGDLVVTANVSTLAALIAAAAGIDMCKHGSPANADQGRHGSSDFISLLGLYGMSRSEVELVVPQVHFGYTEALDTQFKHIHLQTHRYAGVPHMNDIIGPITNPIHPKLLTRRVIGVNHLIDPIVIAEVYRILNQKGITDMQHLIAVRGYLESGHPEGMDELSICSGGSRIATLSEDGTVTTCNMGADTFGVPVARREAISPPTGMSKGGFSLELLYGEETGPALQMVLANAALLFVVAKGYPAREAYAAAADTHAAGSAVRLVGQLCELLAQSSKQRSCR